MAKKQSSLLLKRQQSLAIKLLLPTFIVLGLVAIYPLGDVFVTSFTDREFAGGEDNTTDFVGFQNYFSLLGFTFKELPPVLNDDGTQKIDEKTGEPVYERAIRVLPRDPYRYRELSQFNWFGKRIVVGARNPDFLKAIWNTLVFTVLSVFLETLLGLFIALVVNSNFKAKGALRTTMLVPWAVITVVSARIWEWMLQPGNIGFFNMLLFRLGLGDGQASFLTSAALQMPSMVMVDVWKTTPYMALLILAGLQTIPKELYEAANVDGAHKVRQFFSITFPLLRPALAVALIFRTLDALRVFDVFQVLLGSKMYSMASYNYFQLIQNRQMGLASAIGVIIFIFIAVFAVIYMRLMGVDKE
ncbi:MAG TPA: sugar ABC transporter permease [Thermotogota bacterium]|nr:sugar ABC transporter permease [Thermotogota bacterium]HRW92793.1 sugar ABC transporter permease [Thermotogota bacterium]